MRGPDSNPKTINTKRATLRVQLFGSHAMGFVKRKSCIIVASASMMSLRGLRVFVIRRPPEVPETLRTIFTSPIGCVANHLESSYSNMPLTLIFTLLCHQWISPAEQYQRFLSSVHVRLCFNGLAITSALSLRLSCLANTNDCILSLFILT